MKLKPQYLPELKLLCQVRLNSPQHDLPPAFLQSKASLWVKFLTSWMISSYLYKSLSTYGYKQPHYICYFTKRNLIVCLGKHFFLGGKQLETNWHLSISKYLFIFIECVDIILGIGMYLLPNGNKFHKCEVYWHWDFICMYMYTHTRHPHCYVSP